MTAEAEVEALLAVTARQTPSAEVAVVVEGPDPAVYRLEEATVRLDGAPLPVSNVVPSGPAAQGTPVSDGDHMVSARLVYRGPPTGPYPWEEGPRWALPARVVLQASRGLRFTIRLVVETNAHAPLAAQRLALHAAVEPQMLMAVDDAPLPPPPAPKLPAPTMVAPLTAPPIAVTAVSVAPSAKKKQRKKVSHTTRPVGAVPASAAVAANAGPAAGETTHALEEATARLRSALAAPRDAGAATPGAAPH
jgi:hypothetical protein